MHTHDEEPRYGQHASAEALIRHLATVDHDCDEPEPGSISGAAARLRHLAASDRCVAAAMHDLHGKASLLYLEERSRLRSEAA